MRLRAAGLGAEAARQPGLVGAMGDKEQKRKAAMDQADGNDPDADGAERAFDLWLQRSLHRLYDTVAQEPVPPELLRLIEEDRNSRTKQ